MAEDIVEIEITATMTGPWRDSKYKMTDADRGKLIAEVRAKAEAAHLKWIGSAEQKDRAVLLFRKEPPARAKSPPAKAPAPPKPGKAGADR